MSAKTPAPHGIVQMTDDELAALLDKLEVIEPLIAAVRDLAHDRLEKGRQIPGWKLVAKRATRKWKDEQAAWQTIVAKRPDASRFQVTTVMSPAQAEKAGGKDFYRDVLAPLVEAVSSGTTLAPTDDPRAEIDRKPQTVFRLPF